MSAKEADLYMRCVYERAEELGLQDSFCLVDAHGREGHVHPLANATDTKWRGSAANVLALPAPLFA